MRNTKQFDRASEFEYFERLPLALREIVRETGCPAALAYRAYIDLGLAGALSHIAYVGAEITREYYLDMEAGRWADTSSPEPSVAPPAPAGRARYYGRTPPASARPSNVRGPASTVPAAHQPSYIRSAEEALALNLGPGREDWSNVPKLEQLPPKDGPHDA